jgi:hypothetical protein
MLHVPAATIVTTVPFKPVVVQTPVVVDANDTVAPLVLKANAVYGSSPTLKLAQLPSG